MSRYSGKITMVVNGVQVPVPSAKVYVYDSVLPTAALDILSDDLAAPLANPLTTDEYGDYYFNAADGDKKLEIRVGGERKWREDIHVGPIGTGPAGSPGINGGVGSSAGYGGLFAAANGMAVGEGITRVKLSGYSVAGVGGADYVYDAAVTGATVTANPRTQFLAADGRGFRLDDKQHLTIEMFGGLSGGTLAANGANNLAAMQAAATFKPVSSINYSPEINFGVGNYYCSNTFIPLGICSFRGVTKGRLNGGVAGNVATRLIFPTDTACISIKYAAPVPAGQAGQGTCFDGLTIQQETQGAALNSAHGIVARYTPIIRNCVFTNIAGHCIEIGATAGSGGDSEGNANEWRVENCYAHSSNGDGLYVWGADANGGYSIGFTTAFGVGGCGIRDNAYYTNTHIAPQITGYGAKGVTQGGRHYQLLSTPAQGASTTPGTNSNIWYDLEAGAVNATFPAYVSGTQYQLSLPILATGQGATIIGPYVERGATISHAPSGMGTRGNAIWTRTTALPDVESASHAFVTQTGVGFHYSTGGVATDPTVTANGIFSKVLLGTVDPDAGILGRRNILEVGIEQDGDGNNMLWRWQGKDQRLGWYNAKTVFSISGPATGRTYGRATAQPFYFTMHDYALVDATDGANSRIHGLRGGFPTEPGAVGGEWRWDGRGSNIIGWKHDGSVWREARAIVQQAAQSDLSGGATLSDLVTAHNALLAKLRSAGVLAP